MVKRDLERVGIPYKTEEGTADFHVAGRHTYITELLRNGTSLVEAKELARHSDVNMTMKYTHIGIDDQAKALAKLPSAKVHIEEENPKCAAFLAARGAFGVIRWQWTRGPEMR